MTEQTPSAVLLAAADRVRDLAADTASDDWMFEAFAPAIRREGDARWIAALSPAVAPMIEKWLRETASYFDEFADYWVSVPEQAQNALDCARVILGSGVDTQ